MKNMSGYHIHNALRSIEKLVRTFNAMVCSEEYNCLFGADPHRAQRAPSDHPKYILLRKELERRREGRRSRLPRFGKPIPDNKHHVGEMICAAHAAKKEKA
jgi:hypothetical protein